VIYSRTLSRTAEVVEGEGLNLFVCTFGFIAYWYAFIRLIMYLPETEAQALEAERGDLHVLRHERPQVVEGEGRKAVQLEFICTYVWFIAYWYAFFRLVIYLPETEARKLWRLSEVTFTYSVMNARRSSKGSDARPSSLKLLTKRCRICEKPPNSSRSSPLCTPALGDCAACLILPLIRCSI
jgi:hypothetical protein